MRYVEEFTQYDVRERTIDKLRPKFPGVHDWSPAERRLYRQAQILYIQLTLDYESFVVFARVLMDKLGDGSNGSNHGLLSMAFSVGCQ
jgi:hypothetical protein